jgi:hypothetical protein
MRLQISLSLGADLGWLDEIVLSPQQMRAAIESLPYETPKLSAAAIGHFEGKTFAEALERAIERSKSPVPLLNGPVEQLPAEELKGPMPRYRNNYRRF